ncbi:Putative PinX1-protein [[Torrubiella] hemipterigena]|uniref:PinX1-related protein 1 n=1 Tax=[Torrubiella] hemipterigena TaxID=1531966 RepID=A0A0A1TL86_9HYPO|nr:Putative PinX1-protein [[Torrubiella] hemipterigena]
MGLLQESKSKKRINKDPNNTKWIRDETTFGQRALRSQGWQPGQFLGAQDAPHSQLHTAANASYIRVLLKDDLKGLGFDRAKENEVTGLDVFSDVLSRLNGKSEDDIAGEQMARLAVKTHAFVEAKYGPMRFVRGGLLVGDKVLEEAGSEEKAMESSSNEDSGKKEKKRKAAEVDEDETSAKDTKEKKKRRKEKAASEESESTKSRKDKKAAKSKSKSVDNSDTEPESKEARRARKEAKKARKEEKRLKKEKKKAKKAAAADSSSSSSESEADDSATGTSTPATGTSTPRVSRNFSRSKYIASKKMAVLDSKALAQIFMVKT